MSEHELLGKRAEGGVLEIPERKCRVVRSCVVISRVR